MIEGWGTVGVFLKTEMKAQTGVREKERQIGVITERGRDGAIRRREPDSEQRVFVITSKKKKKEGKGLYTEKNTSITSWFLLMFVKNKW